MAAPLPRRQRNVKSGWRVVAVLLLASSPAFGVETQEKAAALVEHARDEFRAGKMDQALNLADQAVAADKTDSTALLLRASILEARQKFTAAVADYTSLSKLEQIRDSTHASAEIFDRRGSALFCAGEIEASIADFDRAIALEPTREPGHWRRGISYYYARRFEEGARQFEGYQTVDDNDVENAVWRYLCQARATNLDTARKQMLKIGRDSRVPLMQVYDLFLDKTNTAGVVEAITHGDPDDAESMRRHLYAELYLGLWDEINDRPNESLDHMRAAVEKYNVGGYMWHVARVHLKLREGRK